MSDCSDLLGALSEYLDGNEQSAMCAELKQHMLSCDKCRVVVDSAKRTIELYRGTEPVEFPESFRDRLHGSLAEAWKTRKT